MESSNRIRVPNRMGVPDRMGVPNRMGAPYTCQFYVCICIFLDCTLVAALISTLTAEISSTVAIYSE